MDFCPKGNFLWGRRIRRQSRQIHQIQRGGGEIRHQQSLAIGGNLQLAGKAAGRDAHLRREQVALIQYRYGLVGAPAKAIGTGHKHLALSRRHAHRCGTDRDFLYQCLSTAQQLGGVEHHQHVLATRRYISLAAVRRNRDADGTAAGLCLPQYRIARRGRGFCHIDHHQRAGAMASAAALAAVRAGISGFAGGIEQLAIRGEGQSDGCIAGMDFAHRFGALAGQDSLEIIDADGPVALVAHKQEMLVGREGRIDAAGAGAVIEITQRRLVISGNQLGGIEQCHARAIGGGQDPAVGAQRHAGERALCRQIAQNSHRAIVALYHKQVTGLRGQGHKDGAAIGGRNGGKGMSRQRQMHKRIGAWLIAVGPGLRGAKQPQRGAQRPCGCPSKTRQSGPPSCGDHQKLACHRKAIAPHQSISPSTLGLVEGMAACPTG